MCAEEKFANPARIGVLSDHRERRTSLLAAAAPRGRRGNSASPPHDMGTWVEAQGFSPATNVRASAPFLSRRFTRAKSSVLPSSHSPLSTRHCPFLPETVTRVETHVSHRKQTTGQAFTRDVPAHGYFRVLFVSEDGSARAASSVYHQPRHIRQVRRRSCG